MNSLVIPQVRPLAPRTRLLCLALHATGLLYGANMIAAVDPLLLGGDGHDFDRVTGTIATAARAAAVLTAVLVVAWLYRARDNASAISPHPHHWSRNWVLFGWIVPIGSLWIPRRVVKDVWLGSEPGCDRPGPPALNAWWACYLFGVGGTFRPEPEGIGDPSGQAVGVLVLSGLGLLAMVLAVRIVREIARLQERFGA